MTDHERSLEFEVEVIGTPEQVWEAIASGPGISSWYVPHTVEEKEGGAATARFGPGPEMEIPMRVRTWDPPHRVVFDGGNEDEGLAFEWLVEAKDGGSCIVRLVNNGFGVGEDWDNMYDGMSEGWQMFLRNLQLHLEHFPGQPATTSLPGAAWDGDQAALWKSMTEALGIPLKPTLGETLTLQANPDLSLTGRVVEVRDWWFALVTEHPAPGTALIALERIGDSNQASIWTYLHGEAGTLAAADEAAWQQWLELLPAA
jgi:uncharacterized protein YndB with AHSA1/START domain